MGTQKSAVLRLPPPCAAYWNETTRPLVSMAFVAPMLVAYEGGLLLLGPQAMRNGADVWLRYWLQILGFSQYFLLPVLTCGILLGWHHVNRQRWRVSVVIMWGMLLESMALGFLLVMLAELQGSLCVSPPQLPRLFELSGGGTMGQVVAFFGAGIYEELLFRLMLLPLLAGVMRIGGVSHRTSLAAAVVCSSLMFAAAHYRFDVTIAQFHLASSLGDPFDWTSFLFRFAAGGFFSVLFICRGFGITAGTHALYDILVVLA